MSDIEKAFTFLHENIPSWFTNIAVIEEKLARMQSEMARLPVAKSPPLRKKTGSVESIRDLDIIREGSSTPLAAQQSPSTNRKRKSPSVTSGKASGPITYRSRNMIIVQYDGEIQKQFESLVRGIGTGRNMLRKGKMAAKLEALADLASSDDDSEGSDYNDEQAMSRIGYRHRAGLSSMRARGMMGGEPTANYNTKASPELFDTTDKSLEQAQGLCEKAAHQSLRDGDCRKELNDVRKHCQVVLDTATNEVAKYNARMAKEAEDAKNNPPRKHSEPEVLTAATTPELSASPGIGIDSRPMMPSTKSAPPAIPTSKGIDIEIDDDDDEDDFVMPPIRLTSRA
jgi:hypothetical protein